MFKTDSGCVSVCFCALSLKSYNFKNLRIDGEKLNAFFLIVNPISASHLSVNHYLQPLSVSIIDFPVGFFM